MPENFGEKSQEESKSHLEENLGDQEKISLGDVPLIFDKNNPSYFKERLQTEGYKILENREENGEIVTKVEIPKGEHVFVFGFRQVDLGEKRWFHSGLDDKGRRETSSFTFDTDSPDFQKIQKQFLSNLIIGDNLEQTVSKLNEVIQQHITSSMGEETAHSLSEIIQAKKAACASKSIVAGSMLKKQFPRLRVEAVHGWYGTVKDKVSLPFGHEWLRISDGHSCMLYDPMYNKKFHYSFDTQPASENPFARYTVSAQVFAKLHNNIKLTGLGNGIRLTDSCGDEGKEIIVSDEYTIKSQLGGQIAGQVATNGGVLEFINGNMSNELPIANGPRLLYPLIHAEELHFQQTQKK